MPGVGGYSSATGNHVRAILDALNRLRATTTAPRQTTVTEFLHALAITETNDKPTAWGDFNSQHLPLAFSRWQCHIDRLFDEAKRYGLYPHVNEALDDFTGRVVAAIFVHRTEEKYTPVDIALYWHAGHWVRAADSPDYEAYAARFEAACAHA